MRKDPESGRLLAGDWIAHIGFYLGDLQLHQLSGVYANRDAALAAIAESIAKVAWGNILVVHGQEVSGVTGGRLMDNIRVSINVNPRAFL